MFGENPKLRVAEPVDEQNKGSQYARSLIEASLDPLVTISADGKVTDVNEATIAATGVPREGLIGTDFSNYFTEPEMAREGYRQVFAKGFVTDYPLTIRHKDGRLSDVLYNASVYKDSNGSVLGVFAAARDVTAQKQASQYARLLTEATVAAIGVPREGLIGTDFSNYFTEPEKAREGYQQVFAKGVVTDYPLTIRHKDGRLSDVLYNASVYKDLNGSVLGVFAAARDVTAQKQASQYARLLTEATVAAIGVPREQLSQSCSILTPLSSGFWRSRPRRRSWSGLRRRHGGRVWAEGKIDEGATFYFTIPAEGTKHG